MTPEILGVIGAIIGLIITIGLAINGFLIKSFWDSVNKIKIDTTILLERDTSKESRITCVEDNQKEIFKRLNHLEKA